jgi:zinc-binding alcohol dehydrogenase family protein
MKAFGFNTATAEATLFDTDLAAPEGRDLLIAIEAIAVNPVDIKVKSSINSTLDKPKIVGYDAAGIVIAAGPDCELVKVGDKVFYAGDVSRDGCYASHQLVDERIVGFAPRTLSAVEAAAMPLTSITAWEALFSRMRIHPNLDKGKTLLIIGAAGGVGSIAIQLAKQIAELNVVATASRKESADWCHELGADHVINHHSLSDEYAELGIDAPDFILCLNDTDSYYEAVTDLIAPQGMICFVVTSQQNHNIEKLKTKSAGIVWEFMFTRPMLNTDDIDQQQRILQRIAELVDSGALQHTLVQQFDFLTVDNLQAAHQLIASGHTRGKIALGPISNADNA